MNLFSTANGSLVFEMIEFQDDQFGHQLESLYTEIKSIYTKKGIAIPNGLAEKFNDRLAKLIFNRLGIKVKVNYSEHLAAIMPLYANRHHIFMDDLWKGEEVEEQAKFLTSLQGKKGTVDLAKAKISGIYSEYEHTLYINYDDFFDVAGLTPAEATGITLHELGHAFYNISHADRWHSANQILADVALKVHKNKKNNDRTLVYRDLEKYNDNIKKEEFDKMIDGEPVVAGYLWYKYLAEGNFNAGGSNTQERTYDKTSCEQMADNFAARFGYGRDVVTGLEAIYKLYGNINHSWFYSAFWMLFNFITMMSGLVLGIMLIITGISNINPSVIFHGIILALSVIGYIYSSGEATRDYRYDELKFRYKRIRDQIVTRLKDKDLSKKVVIDLVSQIQQIDEVIKGVYEDWSVFRVVLNRVIPAHWAAKNAVEEQQLLETLAANSLFMKAAQLRLKA